MASIQWLPDARDDLARLYAFILPHSSEAAQRAIETILKAVDSLVQFPQSGRPWEPDIKFREKPVQFGAKAYVIRYRLFEDKIIIVRVWHGLEDR